MRDTRIQKKGGGLKAVVCFILGMLFGIIIVIGGVAGGAMYVLNSDLDGVLSTLGVDNSKDENGKNKVINTDPEEGGAQNLLDLITKIVAMSSDPQNLTLGQIDSLVPATHGLVDQLSDALKQYVQVDFEEISDIKLADFGTFIQNKVMEIEPAALIDDLEIQGTLNTILEKVLYGLEANCVTSQNGEIYPLLVDNFTYDSATSTYKRQEDGAALISSQEQYLVKQSANTGLYDIFFFKNSDGNYYISERDPDNIEVFRYTADVGHEYNMYNADTAENTGNYYIDSSGEKVVMEPITIGSLVDGSGLGALEKMRVIELLSGELADDELITTILGDLSMGDLINGNVNFQEKVNAIELGAFLSFDPFEDSMLLYFAYGLTGLSTDCDSQGRYTATYKLGEEDIPVYVTIENGKIDKITNISTGEELSGTTVGTINNTIDNIEISIFVDVTTDNGILPYLAYGITGMKEDNGVWTAKLNGEDCTLDVDPDGKILSVTNNATGKPVPAAGINELSDRVNGVMDNLTIGDIIDVGDNKILKQLADYKISELSTAMNTLEIAGLIDIPADNKILAYLAYGITGIDGTKAMLDGEEVDLTIENGKITGVTKNGEPVQGTTINGINDRIAGLNDSVPLKDIIEIPEGNTLLEKLGDYTLANIGSAVDDIELADVIDIGVEDSGLMLYLAFGVTEVTYDGAQSVYTAEKDGKKVYFKTRQKGGSKYLEGMYAEPEFTTKETGTKISKVSEQINKLTSEVQIKYLIDMSEQSSKLMEKIGNYTISNVGKVVNDLTLPDVMDIGADSAIMAYLAYGITEVDKNSSTAKLNGRTVNLELSEDKLNITGVYEMQDGEKKYIGGTLINDVGTKVDGLTNDLKIKDIIKIDPTDKLMSKIGDHTINNVGKVIEELTLPDVMDIPASNKILAYLAYGITEITVDGNAGTAKLGTENVNLTVDESGNITAVTKDGSAVEETSVKEVGKKVDGLTNDLKIRDIIDIPADDKLMSKIGDYTINTVSEVVEVLEITDVMKVEADSVIMAYLAYGINGVDVKSNTANLDGEQVHLELDESNNITAVYKQTGGDKEYIPGTKVSEMSTRIEGLMNTLTIGELINVPDDNTILNAIKDSTINGIGDTIDNLTLNELYASEIYKVSSYEDRDENGQYSPEKDGEMTYIDAKLRKAVSGEPSDADNEIKFSANYLYYTKDENDSYHLVQIEGKELGKLDALPLSGEYYTYGAVQGMWTLLLTNESGAETPLKLNNIGNIISGVASRLNKSTLNELDSAGILDFETKALETSVTYQDRETTLGELTLDQALSELITMVEFYNTYKGIVGGLGG